MLLACGALGLPAPYVRQQPLEMCTVARSQGIRLAMWLNAAPSAVLGALLVLPTLQLHALGISSGEIATLFVVAAVSGVFVQPWIGRWSDRRGRFVPIRFGLLIIIPILLGFALIEDRIVVAALLVGGLLAVRGVYGPALALPRDQWVAQRLHRRRDHRGRMRSA
jgi:MFS family permease